jgi:hypothetical protein
MQKSQAVTLYCHRRGNYIVVTVICITWDAPSKRFVIEGKLPDFPADSRNLGPARRSSISPRRGRGEACTAAPLRDPAQWRGSSAERRRERSAGERSTARDACAVRSRERNGHTAGGCAAKRDLASIRRRPLPRHSRSPRQARDNDRRKLPGSRCVFGKRPTSPGLGPGLARPCPVSPRASRRSSALPGPPQPDGRGWSRGQAATPQRWAKSPSPCRCTRTRVASPPRCESKPTHGGQCKAPHHTRRLARASPESGLIVSSATDESDAFEGACAVFLSTIA